jgi:hypothetical protein
MGGLPLAPASLSSSAISSTPALIPAGRGWSGGWQPAWVSGSNRRSAFRTPPGSGSPATLLTRAPIESHRETWRNDTASVRRSGTLRSPSCNRLALLALRGCRITQILECARNLLKRPRIVNRRRYVKTSRVSDGAHRRTQDFSGTGFR